MVNLFFEVCPTVARLTLYFKELPCHKLVILARVSSLPARIVATLLRSCWPLAAFKASNRKSVELCGEYVQHVNLCLHQLLQQGPSTKVVTLPEHSRQLRCRGFVTMSIPRFEECFHCILAPLSH